MVTGVQEVTVNGRNLFDKANAVENMILAWSNANEATENGSLLAHEYMLVSEGDTFASNYSMCVFFFDSNDSYLGCLLSGGTTIGKQAGTYVRTFTVPSGYGIAKMKIEYRHNLGGNPSDMTSVTDIMLNVGRRVLPYEPYQEQSYTVDLGSIELCKIGSYQDYIYKSGDDWYVHKETTKVIFNGTSSEDWAIQNTGTVNYFYKISGYSYGLSTSAYSNYFVRTPITNSNTIVGFSLNNYTELRFRPNFSEISITDWQAWLSAHNVYVYYVLDTPTETKITDSTLIGQLDALAGADTYNGKTYIMVVGNNPNLPALLKVEAYKY